MTPVSNGGRMLTIDEKQDQIADTGKIAWKASIVFNIKDKKVTVKDKCDAITGDWTRHQRAWKAIGEADKVSIIDYFK